MSSIRNRWVSLASFFVLSACTTTQLRYQTLQEAGSVESLTQKQIFYNLRLFEKDEFAVPSQVAVTVGTASTTNAVSPTFMTPLGSATMVTTQLANTAATSLAAAVANTTSATVAAATNNSSTATTGSGTSGMTTNTTGSMLAPAGTTTSSQSAIANGNTTSASTAISTGGSTTTTNGTTGGSTTTSTTGNTNGLTNSSQSTHANKTLSLAISDNWTESWTLDPVTDADALRRLSALYRFVLGRSSVIDEATKNAESEADRAKYLKQVEAQFMCDYPMAKPSGTNPTPGAAGGLTTTSSMNPETGVVQTVTQAGGDPKEDSSVTLVFKCLAGKTDGHPTYKIKTAVVDRAQLRLPECVICLDEDPAQLQLQILSTSQSVFRALSSITETLKQFAANAALAQDLSKLDAADPKRQDLQSQIAKGEMKANDQRDKAEKLQGEAKQKLVLIADAGAFEDELDFLNANTTLNRARNAVSPFINPALIFGLLSSSKPSDPIAMKYSWASCAKKVESPRANLDAVFSDVIDLGSFDFHHFYARCDKPMDPKNAFHEFELLVSSAAQVGTPLSGAKPVVAIQTGNTISLQ